MDGDTDTGQRAALIEPDRDDLIGIIARGMSCDDPRDWGLLHNDDRIAYLEMAMDVLDALAAAGMVAVMKPSANDRMQRANVAP